MSYQRANSASPSKKPQYSVAVLEAVLGGSENEMWDAGRRRSATRPDAWITRSMTAAGFGSARASVGVNGLRYLRNVIRSGKDWAERVDKERRHRTCAWRTLQVDHTLVSRSTRMVEGLASGELRATRIEPRVVERFLIPRLNILALPGEVRAELEAALDDRDALAVEKHLAAVAKAILVVSKRPNPPRGFVNGTETLDFIAAVEEPELAISLPSPEMNLL